MCADRCCALRAAQRGALLRAVRCALLSIDAPAINCGALPSTDAERGAGKVNAVHFRAQAAGTCDCVVSEESILHAGDAREAVVAEAARVLKKARPRPAVAVPPHRSPCCSISARLRCAC